MTTARDGHPNGYQSTAFDVGGFSGGYGPRSFAASNPASPTEYSPRDNPPLTPPDSDDEPMSELEERYEWVVGLMSSFTDERVVRAIVAVFSLSMAVCATLEILFGFGARTQPALGIQIASAVFAFLAAVWWSFIRWPRLRPTFVFVILSDLFILAATVTADMPPEYAVGKLAFFAVLGLFAGVFLDRWMLAAHVIVCSLSVTGVVAYNVAFQGVPLLGALVVWVPVMSLVLAIPALLYLFVRSTRLDQS